MDKPNDEHQHIAFHKDGKDEDMNTRYDACKFKQILQNHSKPMEPNRLFECIPSNLRTSSDDEGNNEKCHDPHQKSLENGIFTVTTIIPTMALPLLHDLAQQMVQAGHQQQLFETYRDTRAPVLAQSLEILGVQRISEDDVQRMNSEVYEAKIGNWIHNMRISVKLLFAAEKKICDQILNGVDESLRDQCFAELAANSFDMLLSFGDACAKSHRSPEKLFFLLDMYEMMSELQPEIDLVFGSKCCTGMIESALNLTKRLGQTAQETFADFEEAVEKDGSIIEVMDGTVHPLSSYVVKYVIFLLDYQSTLRLLSQQFGTRDPDSELGAVTTRIMHALLNNLDGKSKQFEDTSLTQLFLMNNVHYIVRSVRRLYYFSKPEQNPELDLHFHRSEVKDLLVDDWVEIHQRIVQQHANQYKRVSWEKILQCLTIESSGNSLIGKSNLSRTTVKDRFMTFNSQFEELYQRQCQWTVPDTELRESLRLAIAEDLLPAFRSFLKRFGPMIESGKNQQKYIRFTPEGLEGRLNEFF